jgi:hypothetical protein
MGGDKIGAADHMSEHFVDVAVGTVHWIMYMYGREVEDEVKIFGVAVMIRDRGLGERTRMLMRNRLGEEPPRAIVTVFNEDDIVTTELTRNYATEVLIVITDCPFIMKGSIPKEMKMIMIHVNSQVSELVPSVCAVSDKTHTTINASREKRKRVLRPLRGLFSYE